MTQMLVSHCKVDAMLPHNVLNVDFIRWQGVYAEG
jgi:hypothetical protein